MLWSRSIFFYPWYEASHAEAKFFRLRCEVDARIEPVLLEESNDRSGFLEEISRSGEAIYSALKNSSSSQ
jgi:hypothetical protein